SARPVPDGLLRDLAQHVAGATAQVTLTDLVTAAGGRRATVSRAVDLLGDLGAVTVAGRSAVAWSDPARTVAEMLAAADEEQRNRERQATARLEMMRAYAEAQACRRQFLLPYLGQPYSRWCEGCDVCAATPVAARPA